MTGSSFGFYFEKEGRAAAQGAIAPAEQYFEGSRVERSVVRETGQNSLDAATEDGPVRMEFELRTMPTADIPGIQGLRDHLVQVEEATRGAQGHQRMRTAVELANAETVTVLRISDFGTMGLTGSESTDTPRSPLSALTRSAGISANDGMRGGSFGIGSAVGPMASDLSTVFYTSMPRGEERVVLAGYSRLASHKDSDGILRVGDGFYTDLSVENDFRYLRTAVPFGFGPFEPRAEPGTDIFIMGYRKAGDDPLLRNIRNAFVDSFMMAIHAGHLAVSGKSGANEWRLDAETLKRYADERPESQAFYRAITDPSPVVRTFARFGEVRLYINVDPSLAKTLHTITMRRPLMHIDTFRHTSIPVKYAAVLVCADNKGNRLLRGLEPPQHDHWDPARDPANGPAALKELKGFVRQELKERVQDRVGDLIEIKGLARFLPSGDVATVPANAPTAAGQEQTGRPGLGEGATHESATTQGKPGDASPARSQPPKSVRVRVQQSARSTDQPDDNPVTTGQEKDGSGKRESSGGSLPGSGQPDAGRSRIPAGQVEFKSWFSPSITPGRTTLQVALTSAHDIHGDIELVTLGAGGAPEEDYRIPILAAHMVVNDTREPLTWEGNMFKDVKVTSEQPTRLEIELKAGHRYRLDVK